VLVESPRRCVVSCVGVLTCVRCAHGGALKGVFLRVLARSVVCVGGVSPP